MAGRGCDDDDDCDANVNVNKYYKICICVCVSVVSPLVCEQQRHAQVKGEKGNKVGVGQSTASEIERGKLRLRLWLRRRRDYSENEINK